jgi:hypothetical protein
MFPFRKIGCGCTYLGLASNYQTEGRLSIERITGKKRLPSEKLSVIFTDGRTLYSRFREKHR